MKSVFCTSESYDYFTHEIETIIAVSTKNDTKFYATLFNHA